MAPRDGARAPLERALLTRPDDDRVRGDLARLLATQGDVERAAAVAAGLSAPHPRVAATLRAARARNWRLATAHPAADRACRQADDALQRGDPKAALQAVHPHMAANLGDVWVLAARALAAAGDHKTASALRQRSVAARRWLAPRRLHQALRWAAQAMGPQLLPQVAGAAPGPAVGRAARAVAAAPHDAAAWAALGSACADHGRTDAAEAALQHSLALQPAGPAVAPLLALRARPAPPVEGAPTLSVIVWGDWTDDATGLVSDLLESDDVLELLVVGAACEQPLERPPTLAAALQRIEADCVLLLHASLRAAPGLAAHHRAAHRADRHLVAGDLRVLRRQRYGDEVVSRVGPPPGWSHGPPLHVSAPAGALEVDTRGSLATQLPTATPAGLTAWWVQQPPLELLFGACRQAGLSAGGPTPRPRTLDGWSRALTARARHEARRQEATQARANLRGLLDGAPQPSSFADQGAGALRRLLQAEVAWGRAQASGTRAPGPPLEDALMSVIMLNLNGQGHLQGAIESLRRNTPGPVELVVVDNGSTDASLDWLRAQDDLVLVELGENLGAPAGRNRGLEVARGQTILFCDNDVVFTPSWRPLLLAHLDAWPDVGAVGPMSDVVIGPQLVSEPPPPGVDLDAWARAFTEQRRGQAGWTQRLILFCMLFRREALDQIGGLDTRFWRWGFEDDDLSYRLARAGWAQRVAADCFIQHLGSRTAKRANLDYDALLQANFKRFAHKWGLNPALQYGDPIPTDPILAPDWDPETDVVPYRRPGVEPPTGPLTLLRWEG